MYLVTTPILASQSQSWCENNDHIYLASLWSKVEENMCIVYFFTMYSVLSHFSVLCYVAF